MKQLAKMGWVRQGLLGLVVCAVMSPSYAMSVRERYLLQHPQAAAHQEATKPAQTTKVVKHSRKHHAIEKDTPAKKHHQRVIVPKHSKSKFDKQQAHDAEAALKHGKVKHDAPVSRHKHQAASTKKAHPIHHVVKHSTEPRVHHHKKHHAK